MKKVLLVLLVLFGLQTQAQTQQPYFCCDSITYSIDPSQGFNIFLDTTNIVHNPDSIEVLWSICNSDQCYTAEGMFAYFGQIMQTDTIKACYDAYLYEANNIEVCSRCDSLVFDQNIYSWVLLNNVNLTYIQEMFFEMYNKKTYDLHGRELFVLPEGVIYVRNRKLYIKQ